MTMLECRECKRAVSDEAKACPHCGADPRAKKPAASWGLRLLAAMVTAVLLFVVSGYYVGKRSSDDAINRASARMAELGHPEASVAVSNCSSISLRSWVRRISEIPMAQSSSFGNR